MKKKTISVLMALSLGIILFGYCSAQQANVMTVKSNIFMANNAENPPVNNSIQTITLEFSEKLDPATVADGIKLYRMNSDGNPIAEPCIVKINKSAPNCIDINNRDVTSFAEGEEYKIEISTDLKSVSGLSLETTYTGYFATNHSLNLSDVFKSNGERTQIVIISDLHLGVDDAFAELKKNRPALVSFLNQIRNSPNVKELVIAGDMLDEWFLPMDYQMPDSPAKFFDLVAANNQTIVDALNAIIRAGEIKVTYVPGNHDLLLTAADIERIFPGMNQARDGVQGLGTYVTGTNSEIAIEHGHKYNFFCAPDPISNRDITKNNSSILPPGYFFTRIATSSVIEGHPASSNIFPDMTVDKTNKSQLGCYMYYQVWRAILAGLTVKESLSDKVIKTNIDGYTQTYSINDLLPRQNAADGTIDVNLYKGIQDSWDQRQTLNGVKVKIPVNTAILKAADAIFTDDQAKTQFFDIDDSKRIVVFGHTHVARILPMTNFKGKKTVYANSGTWIDKGQGHPTMTFVVITPAKSGSAIETVNLYQYSLDKSIAQWGEAQAITNHYSGD